MSSSNKQASDTGEQPEQTLDLLNKLPIDVLLIIFNYLAPEHVLSARLLNKQFLEILDSRQYFRTRLYQEFPEWKRFYDHLSNTSTQKIDWFYELKKIHQQNINEKEKYTTEQLNTIHTLRSGKLSEIETLLSKLTPAEDEWIPDFFQDPPTSKLGQFIQIIQDNSLQLAPEVNELIYNNLITSFERLYEKFILKHASEVDNAKHMLTQAILYLGIILQQPIPNLHDFTNQQTLFFLPNTNNSENQIWEHCVKYNRTDLLQNILQKSPDLLYQAGRNLYLPILLEKACDLHQLDVIPFLLQKAQEKNQFTDLTEMMWRYFLCLKNIKPIVTYGLLKKIPFDRFRLTEIAIEQNVSWDIVRVLLPNKKDLSPLNQQALLICALAYRNWESAKNMLKQGFSYPEDIAKLAAKDLSMLKYVLTELTKDPKGEIDPQIVQRFLHDALQATMNYYDRNDASLSYLLTEQIQLIDRKYFIELICNSYSEALPLVKILTADELKMHGNTILARAIQIRDENLAVYLLNAGVQPNFEGAGNDFYKVVYASMVQTAKTMLEKYPNTAFNTNNHHILIDLLKPLHRSFDEVKAKMVPVLTQAIIEFQPPVWQIVDKDGTSHNLFKLALDYNIESLAQHAIAHGPQPASFINSPLLRAIAHGFTEAAREILKKHVNYSLEVDVKKNNAFIIALKYNSSMLPILEEQLRVTHKMKPNEIANIINRTNSNGTNALYYAAKKGNDEQVIWLIEHGALLLPNKKEIIKNVKSRFAKQLLLLQNYLQTREAEGQYALPRTILTSVFPPAKKSIFTKTDKIDAANFYKGYLLADDKNTYCDKFELSQLEAFKSALTEGRLSKIISIEGSEELKTIIETKKTRQTNLS